jgi:gamma-glutamyl:cysteine ligase YbdK (ATP-grasp superfamily)
MRTAIDPMTDYIQAWQCVGCGRIEAPQTCLGVCRDRKILMVAKDDHERVVADLQATRRRVDVALAMLARIVHSTPREEQWERSYRALQEQARDAIAKIEAG